MGTKNLSIRVKEEDFRFLTSLAEERDENLSQTVKELLQKGRVMAAIEGYRKGEISLQKAATIAGVPLARMMDILKDYGVKANLEQEDYLQSLKTARELW